MNQLLFSQDPYYQTVPPQSIGPVKVKPILEYLTFSGTSLHIAIQKSESQTIRIHQSAHLVDVKDDVCLIELPELKMGILPEMLIEVAFGYKRKRAYFKTKITLVEGKLLTLQIPEAILLTNLRRNPRVQIDRNLHQKHFQVQLQAETGVGPITINRFELFEFSQLGMSLFVDRDAALLLPGDKITKLQVELDGERILDTAGVVHRVEMNRKSSTLSNSYEVILLFDSSLKPTEPRSVTTVNRTAKRIPILDSKPCFFTAEHPFFPGRVIEGQVFEISTSGLSCMLDKTPFPIIPGMRFPKSKLQLPHKTPKELTFEIAHVNFKSDGEVNRFKLGGEFITSNVELMKDISAYAQETAGAQLSDLKEEELDLLWEFLFETNFIYQNKRRQIQNNSKEILETYRRLLAKENTVVKKLVMKKDAEIKGHVSAIRFYDHAWIIQHLNALKAEGAAVGQAMVQGIVDFFYDKGTNQKSGVFHLISFFRPDNLYPAIVFGESAKKINDPKKSITMDFSFGIYSEPCEITNIQHQSVTMDDPSDIPELLNALIQQGHGMLLRAIDLHTPNPLQLEVEDLFKELGLYRKRHLVTVRDEECTVFALVECASPGVNLSELTNSVFLFCSKPQHPSSRSLAERAVETAAQEYFLPRDLNPVVLEPMGLTLAKNVSWSKVYTCWITSAAAVADFEGASKEILRHFKSYIAARAQPQSGVDKKTSHGS